MMDIEALIARVWELEGKYYDLQSRYQTLIHQYESLKEEYEKASAGHRDGQQALYDSPSSDTGY